MQLKRNSVLFFILLIMTLSRCYAKSDFLIYYDNNASIKYLNSFKEVVLDPDHYNYVFGLKPYKYGYLSIGEVENFREYFKFVKNMGVLGKENPNWKGAYFVKLESGKWQQFVINYLVDAVLSKGYNGLFLDTVDSLISSGENKELIVNFINNIKSRFPNIKIIMNRGFEIADKVNVDGILLESTITSYNFKTKKYFFIKYKNNFKIPKRIRRYSVDYWYLNDIENIKKIYKIALKRGYRAFVSDITLQRIPPVRYDSDKKKFVKVVFPEVIENIIK